MYTRQRESKESNESDYRDASIDFGIQRRYYHTLLYLLNLRACRPYVSQIHSVTRWARAYKHSQLLTEGIRETGRELWRVEEVSVSRSGQLR